MPIPHVPYSKVGLERLASALNVNTSYLWVSPDTNAFSLRDLKSSQIKSQSIGVQQKSQGQNKEIE